MVITAPIQSRYPSIDLRPTVGVLVELLKCREIGTHRQLVELREQAQSCLDGLKLDYQLPRY